jgi:hypothetical protein
MRIRLNWLCEHVEILEKQNNVFNDDDHIQINKIYKCES